MRRAFFILIVLVAVFIAYFLGRRSSEPATTADRPEQAVSAEAAPLAAIQREAVTSLPPAGSDVAVEQRSDRPSVAPAIGPSQAVAQHGAGPRPLSATNEERLRKWALRIAQSEQPINDLLTLSENEPPGPDNAYLENMIAASIQKHGGGYIGLQLSSPRCTQNVCRLMAVGSVNTQDKSSDWQRLSGFLMSEPWFRDYFNDMRTVVGGDSKGTLYLTFYIRKG